MLCFLRLCVRVRQPEVAVLMWHQPGGEGQSARLMTQPKPKVFVLPDRRAGGDTRVAGPVTLASARRLG